MRKLVYNTIIPTKIIRDAIEILKKEYGLMIGTKLNPKNGRSYFKNATNGCDVFFMKLWGSDNKISKNDQKWINIITGDFEQITEKWVCLTDNFSYRKYSDADKQRQRFLKEFNTFNIKRVYFAINEKKQFQFKGVFTTKNIDKQNLTKTYICVSKNFFQ